MQKRREMKKACFVSFESEMNDAMRKTKVLKKTKRGYILNTILLQKSKSSSGLG